MTATIYDQAAADELHLCATNDYRVVELDRILYRIWANPKKAFDDERAAGFADRFLLIPVAKQQDSHWHVIWPRQLRLQVARDVVTGMIDEWKLGNTPEIN